jgi:hypothetical protein
MKPAIQASNIRFCNIKSNSLTVKWDNGDGERRLVVIVPEKKVNTSNDSGSSDTYEYGDNDYESTFGNPDPFEVRQNFPGYYPGYKSDYFNYNSNGLSSCDSTSYLAPAEALPLSDTTYRPSIIYGKGDELNITTRGLTSSNPTTCPSPSPSPSYEIIEDTGDSNGTFVVYEGLEEEVTVLNLKPETGYYVGVFEFNVEDDCIEYLYEQNWTKVITSCHVETGTISFTVTDCRTCRPIVSVIEIIDKYGKICDLGSTDNCGKYKSGNLETSMGYKIKVTAPNYDDYTISNAFIQPKPELRRSELHPNWTQGTKILPFYTTSNDKENTNHYDIKM